MNKRTLYLVLLIFLIVIGFFFYTNPFTGFVSKDLKNIERCGKITSPGDYRLTSNLSGMSYCITIDADNVNIDADGFYLIGIDKLNDYGIYVNGHKNIVLKNFNVINYGEGIFIQDSNNINVINNNLSNNLQSIFLLNSVNSNIKNNIIKKSSNIGLGLVDSSNNHIENNLVRDGLYALSFNGDQYNSFIGNSYINNIYPTVRIIRNSSIINVGSKTYFNFILPFTKESCASCIVNLHLYPDNEHLFISQNGENITGLFTPTSKGIYSITFEIIDPNNNHEYSKYIYLVDPAGNSTEPYYIRGVNPTHGQAQSWGIYHQDSGSLLSNPSLSSENRICTDWIQISPDILPDYLFGVVKQVDFSLEYNTSNQFSSVGVQRFNTYNDIVTQFVNISDSNNDNIRKSFSFNVSWPINYYWEWYWQSIKIVADSGNPELFIKNDNFSVVHISYIYSSTPAIESASNDQILLLSAVQTDKGYELILDGNGRTDMKIKMPLGNYQLVSDGRACNNDNCNIISQNDGDIEFSILVKGLKKVEIVKV